MASVLQHYFVRNAVDDGVRTGKGYPSQRALEEHMIAEAQGHLRQIDAQACIDARGLTDSVIDPIDCSGSDPRVRILWGGVSEATKTRLHWNKSEFEEENNHSVVVRVDFGKVSALVTGDLEEQAIGDLVVAYSGTGLLDVDIWEVGHHGSTNGTTDPFLAAMSPAMAVVCVGNPVRKAKWTAWDYGHPRDSVIWMIEQRVTGVRTPVSAPFATAKYTFAPPREIDKAIFGTGWDGTIVVTARKNGEIRVGEDVIVAAH